MNFIKLFILLIVISSSIQEANAGIFFNRRSYSTPTYNKYSTQSRIPQYNGRIRQWTYPGDIGNHLRNHHHINTNGMSFEQMKYLHNILHESAL